MTSHASGFTLLELLLVVAIGAVAVSGVMLALPTSENRQIAQEAERLAALLEAGRARSRTTGEPVIFVAHGSNFEFSGGQSEVHLPKSWLFPEFSTGVGRVSLGPEPVIDPQSIEIRLGNQLRKVIATDGVRPFAVIDP